MRQRDAGKRAGGGFERASGVAPALLRGAGTAALLASALATVLAGGLEAAAAKAKPKAKAKKPPATAAPAADPASAAAAAADPLAGDPRPLYDSAPLFADLVPRVEFVLRPGCDGSLIGPELDACKKNLPKAVDEARAEVEGKVARMEVFVRRGDFDTGRGVFDIEIGKNGLLRERGVALDMDVAVRPAALAAPKGATSLADFGVKPFVVTTEKFKSEDISPLHGFSRGSGWAVVKVDRIVRLVPDCAKKPCVEFPAVLVEVVSWGVPLGGGKAVLDGKVVPEFGRVAAAADAGPEPAKAPGTHTGPDVISAGPDKIDSMLDTMKTGSGTGTAAPVAGTADLSPADITRVINDRKWRLKKCASFGEGTLSYEFVVEVDGTVHEVVLKTASFKDKPLAKCAEKILAETVFPAHKGPPKKLTYPFIIK